jgi:ABC-type antimicrobial peptide transport system permease subunit
MEPKQNIQPPNWATRFLSWYCKPELLEDLQGDLNEYFDRNVKSSGIRKAKLIYVLDVFKFLRLYTIRKPEFINFLLQGIMIGSYIKTSGRTLVRNKLFSIINIVGLSLSMSVGLLMITLINDVLSYDKFHTHNDRIYRVNSQYENLGEKDHKALATTSLLAAQEISENFTGIEKSVILNREFFGDIITTDKTIPLNGLWASESFFDFFSFRLLQGNAATALKEPFSLVLTETSAHRLFGRENALGKTVTYLDDLYTITGIAQDVPKFSHMKFEMLGSLSTREVLYKDLPREHAWNNIWNTYIYVLLPEHTNLEIIHTNLNRLSTKYNQTIEHTKIQLALQPMSNIMISEAYGNQLGPTFGSTTLWIFIAISLIVILSACFNYTNLSIARALKRTREIGIRKVIGAKKSSVFSQFMIESIIISFIALAFAFLLFLVLRPHLISLFDLQKTLLLHLSPQVIGYFIAFAIIVGISAGVFPAIFFARINAINVLKNTASVKLFGSISLRKTLIVFQYSISIMFITSTLIMFKQYSHFLAYDLGFSTKNILTIKMQGNKSEALKKELAELPEVKTIAQSTMLPGAGIYWATPLRYPAQADSANVFYNAVDENYLPLHNHVFLAGRNFLAKSESAAETEIIVNEHLLKRFNIANQNPVDAIGEVLELGREHTRVTIIGVIKNFTYGKANNHESQEVIFRYSNTSPKYLNVSILSSDWHATHAKIESIWKNLDTVHPLEAKFYSAELEETFSEFKASLKLGGFLATLAICIASLGLLGMIVFTTETRLKEISLRKVFGASEIRLIYLLGKGFLLLLLISSAIALPITYFLWNNVLLPDIINHSSIHLPEFFGGVIGIVLIAVLMIGSQTFKVAYANPAEVLKNE